MNIKFVYRYYRPDNTPYALLLEQIVEALAAANHTVDVYAGQPSYRVEDNQTKAPSREALPGGGEITRVAFLPERGRMVLKIINSVLFSGGAALSVLFSKKPDVLWFGTTPPVVQAFLLSVVAKLRGIKTIYQMQDIHPEIVQTNGQLTHPIAAWALHKLDNFSIKNAAVVSVLSEDMKATLEKRTGPLDTIKVINNFALGGDSLGTKPARKPGAKVRFAYTGNMGNFQNLEQLVDAFAKVDPARAELNFVGDGRLKSKLVATCKERSLDHIHFHDTMSAEAVLKFLNTCDVGFISLAPDVYRYAYPTKSHTYFSSGVRVFAMLEPASELAKLVETHNLGRVVDGAASVDEVTLGLNGMIEDIGNTDTPFCVPKEIWHHSTACGQWLDVLAKLESSN